MSVLGSAFIAIPGCPVAPLHDQGQWPCWTAPVNARYLEWVGGQR